jgi:hypothetical protein
MQNIVVNQLGEMISQPHQWAVGLDRTRILGLLKLPHFGRGQYATTCIKQLLAVTHGGDIWLDKPIPITVELITQITGLPSRGMDPALILDDKSKEKALAEEMKKKYGTTRGTRGIIIKRINNAATQLGTKILACKLLRKCPQRRSTSRSHRSCSSVRRRHLRELGTLSIKLVPSGLQGCTGPRYRIPLLMASHPHSLHGMAGTRVCNFLY